MSISVFVSKEQKLFLFDSSSCPTLKDEICTRNKLDYGFVICRAIIEFMKRANHFDKFLIEEKLRELIEAIDMNEEFQDKDFIEVTKYTNDNKGYVFIDHTDGVKPFVLYSKDDSTQEDVSDEDAYVEDYRSSLQNVLDAIADSESKLWSVLHSCALSGRRWNKEVKNIAWQEFNQTKKKSKELCEI